MLNTDSTIQAIGNGLLGKIRYDFRFSYEAFKFLAAKNQKEQLEKRLINKNLYKKIK